MSRGGFNGRPFVQWPRGYLVIVSEISVSGSETYLVVIAYTKLSLCLTFSLIRTRATSLDSLLL